jgi:hypothetical protein
MIDASITSRIMSDKKGNGIIDENKKWKRIHCSQ